MFSLKHARAPTTADELWEHIHSEFMAIDGHRTILHLQTKEEARTRSWKMELDDFGSENEGLVRFRKGDIREFLVENFKELLKLSARQESTARSERLVGLVGRIGDKASNRSRIRATSSMPAHMIRSQTWESPPRTRFSCFLTGPKTRGSEVCAACGPGDRGQFRRNRSAGPAFPRARRPTMIRLIASAVLSSF
jgi:hypothetical protein